jgi:hypothetical protein
MKFRLLLAPLVFTLLSCFSGAYGADEQDDKDTHGLVTTIEKFRERYFVANGGREKLLSIRSMRVEALLTRADGVQGKIIYIKESPALVRSIWYGPRGIVLRRGSNGVKSWEMLTTADGTQKGRITTDMPSDVFEWVIANPEGCGATLELLPVERSERAEYYHVRAKFADGRQKDYFLDTTSFGEARVVDTAADGTEKTYLVDKPVKFDGIWFPGVQMELASDGKELNRIEIVDVQMNVGLLPCFFDPPEEILQAMDQETQPASSQQNGQSVK